MRRAFAIALAVAALACAGPIAPAEPEVPTAPGPGDTVDRGEDRVGQPRRKRGKPSRPPRAPAPGPVPGEPVPEPAPPPGEDDDVAGPPSPKPRGITQTGDRSWTVTRALADRWQDNPYKLADAREKGEGWELFAVRKRDAWHLGMRNLDVLLEVNGHELATQAQLLAAYLALKNDERFDVVFLRDGERRVHHYEIVDR